MLSAQDHVIADTIKEVIDISESEIVDGLINS